MDIPYGRTPPSARRQANRSYYLQFPLNSRSEGVTMPAHEASPAVEGGKGPGYNGPILGVTREFFPEDYSQLGDQDVPFISARRR